jgi:hypothetical protein
VSSVSELATAELRQGHWPELQIWLARLRGSTGPDDAWREDHAATLQATSWLYSGQAAQAEPALRRLLAALERDEGGVSPATEPVRRLHAEALLRLGRTQEALVQLHTTEANQLKLSRPGHPSVAATQVLLGVALARTGDLPAAREKWQAAAPALARALGPDHPFTQVATGYALLAALTDRPTAADIANARLQADKLQRSLGWQDGVLALSALLRAPQAAPVWSRLPVVL